jgi:hypothetical protein
MCCVSLFIGRKMKEKNERCVMMIVCGERLVLFLSV